MRHSPRAYASALLALLDQEPAGRRPALIRSFLALLRRRRHLTLLPRIVDAVVDDRLTAAGAVRIIAETARPLPATYASTLARALKRPVHLEVRVDRSLIGGLRLTIGERRIDATVPTLLAQLERQLRDAAPHGIR